MPAEHLQPLRLHRNKFQRGKPIPFNVYDLDGRLLLARGYCFESEEQLERLIDRDATVDPTHLIEGRQRIEQATSTELLAMWDSSIAAIGRALRASPNRNFIYALDSVSHPLILLIERDPDLAIIQTLRADSLYDSGANYSVRHSIHTAIAAWLAATRLNWSLDSRRCLLRSSLTMNIAMAELQNRLVIQQSPLTPLQRAEIHSHPERSAAMLEAAGVSDPEWLSAVRQHHETDDGTGYPRQLKEVTDIARLVHSADSFTAKLSPRITRRALAADAAARLQFLSGKANQIDAALIKEFGIYPPGVMVVLSSGELGMVVRRGEKANTPIVASFTDRLGGPRPDPIRRDTAKPEFAIVAIVAAGDIKVRVETSALIQAAAL